MKIYSVYIDPEASDAYGDAAFIPERFSLYAFLFTALWALYHRLWVVAFLMVVIHGGGMLAGMQLLQLSPAGLSVLQLGLRVSIGFFAHDLWRWWLRQRGWVLSDVVVAQGELEAAHRYYERQLQAETPQDGGPGRPAAGVPRPA